MINQELNTALYEKMAAEQTKFRDWLLAQTPEEILKHTYEYTVREDIVMCMEELALSEGRARALLSSPSPLGDVYSEFEQRETNYMDILRNSIEERAAEMLKRQRELPVYMQTATYAREHDELPQFRASNKLNVACKEALEEAINGNYGDNRLNVKAAFEQVAEQFGLERMKYVLAVTVTQKDWDARISSDNKAWAKTVPLVENRDAWGDDRNSAFVVGKAHTGLVDMFVTYARKVFAQEKAAPEKKPSVLDGLKAPHKEAITEHKPHKKPDMER